MNKKGFTLIEVLVVVAIISIIAALVIPSIVRAKKKSEREENGEKVNDNTYSYAETEESMSGSRFFKDTKTGDCFIVTKDDGLDVKRISCEGIDSSVIDRIE